MAWELRQISLTLFCTLEKIPKVTMQIALIISLVAVTFSFCVFLLSISTLLLVKASQEREEKLFVGGGGVSTDYYEAEF